MASRSNATVQGAVTIHVWQSKHNIEKRKNNATYQESMNAQQRKRPGQTLMATPYFANGNHDLCHHFLPKELVFSLVGLEGMTEGGKIEAFTSFNGLPVEGSLEDFASNLVFLGTSKSDYYGNSPSTPQTGVAVNWKGLTTIIYMCDAKKPTQIHPGMTLMFAIPDPSQTLRSIPLCHGLPREKILPIIKPLDLGLLATDYQQVGEQLCKDRIRKHPLGVFSGTVSSQTIGGANNTSSLGPYERMVHQQGTATITLFTRFMEVLLARNAINLNQNAWKSGELMKDLFSVADEHTGPSADKARADFDIVLQAMGFGPGLNNGASVVANEKNELQKDILMTAMWPHVPSEHKETYAPLTFHLNDSPSSHLNNRRTYENYVNLAKRARMDADTMRVVSKQNLEKRIIGTSMSGCLPQQNTPTVDVFVQRV